MGRPGELDPFVQTGSSGLIFTEDEPGVKVQGDAFDSFVPFDGVDQIQNGYALGFQYFTAGDVEEPASQTVLIRVSPIPEPSTLLLTALGVAILCRARGIGRKSCVSGRSDKYGFSQLSTEWGDHGAERRAAAEGGARADSAARAAHALLRP